MISSHNEIIKKLNQPNKNLLELLPSETPLSQEVNTNISAIILSYLDDEEYTAFTSYKKPIYAEIYFQRATTTLSNGGQVIAANMCCLDTVYTKSCCTIFNFPVRGNFWDSRILNADLCCEQIDICTKGCMCGCCYNSNISDCCMWYFWSLPIQACEMGYMLTCISLGTLQCIGANFLQATCCIPTSALVGGCGYAVGSIKDQFEKDNPEHYYTNLTVLNKLRAKCRDSEPQVMVMDEKTNVIESGLVASQTIFSSTNNHFTRTESKETNEQSFRLDI